MKGKNVVLRAELEFDEKISEKDMEKIIGLITYAVKHEKSLRKFIPKKYTLTTPKSFDIEIIHIS